MNHRKLREKMNRRFNRRDEEPSHFQETKKTMELLINRASQDRKLFSFIEEEASKRGLVPNLS